jgi:hypothetical protein
MKTKAKNIAVSALFALILAALTLSNIILPDSDISRAERRKLKQFSGLILSDIPSGKFFTDFEDYALDQFVLRDAFRGVKAFSRFNLFFQKDNNDIFIVDGGVYKIEYPLKEASVIAAAKKFNKIARTYLEGMNLYYSVIPDKTILVAAQNGYPTVDFDRMVKLLRANAENMQYIDIANYLSIDDYYRTDIHWRQERISDVADALIKAMGGLGALSGLTPLTLSPFYGSYYGQSALALKPDELTYLTGAYLDACTVYDYQTGKTLPIYAPEAFGGIDPYDVFLHGARSLLTITNPNCQSGKSLIIFRDSFASSLAPLLLGEYEKITLVDLRYLLPTLIPKYIDLSEYTDALFLYNTIVLNNSAMLR